MDITPWFYLIHTIYVVKDWGQSQWGISQSFHMAIFRLQKTLILLCQTMMDWPVWIYTSHIHKSLVHTLAAWIWWPQFQQTNERAEVLLSICGTIFLEVCTMYIHRIWSLHKHSCKKLNSIQKLSFKKLIWRFSHIFHWRQNTANQLFSSFQWNRICSR